MVIKTKSILVVDDSPMEVQLLTKVLSGEGYQCTVAVDGEEAIQKAEQGKPDLIVLDVVLPKKSGFQVCRHLKSSPATSSIKIIVLSSKTQDSDKYWGMRQGADHYMTKPFKSKELLEAIAKFL